MSARAMMVMMRRQERREAAALEAWNELRGDLSCEEKMDRYVTSLRLCDRLRGILKGMSASLNLL